MLTAEVPELTPKKAIKENEQKIDFNLPSNQSIVKKQRHKHKIPISWNLKPHRIHKSPKAQEIEKNPISRPFSFPFLYKT